VIPSDLVCRGLMTGWNWTLNNWRDWMASYTVCPIYISVSLVISRRLNKSCFQVLRSLNLRIAGLILYSFYSGNLPNFLVRPACSGKFSRSIIKINSRFNVRTYFILTAQPNRLLFYIGMSPMTAVCWNLYGIWEYSAGILIYLMVTSNKLMASHSRSIYTGKTFAPTLKIEIIRFIHILD
jgi:hypothetical protein